MDDKKRETKLRDEGRGIASRTKAWIIVFSGYLLKSFLNGRGEVQMGENFTA